MPICKSCEKNICGKTYPGGLCQGCYIYFRHGGEVHEPPPAGTIQKDDNGYVICHICGKSYRRLGSHVRESHDMTVAEYKETFGLCRSAKTTEMSYSNKMHNYSYNRGTPEMLIKAGINTRIKPGDSTMRKNKPVRLQEVLNKRNRTINRKEKSCDSA